MAEQMGAMHSIHLTSDVTHLLVGNTDSDKYKFVARERNDVLAMNPEWIEAVRHSWTQGEDMDVEALEKQYKLPTLLGLKICITGFSDRELVGFPIGYGALLTNAPQSLSELTCRRQRKRMEPNIEKT
jgi:hypothetical protein